MMTDHPVTLARQLFLQTRWFGRAGMSKFSWLQKAYQLIYYLVRSKLDVSIKKLYVRIKGG